MIACVRQSSSGILDLHVVPVLTGKKKFKLASRHRSIMVILEGNKAEWSSEV